MKVKSKKPRKVLLIEPNYRNKYPPMGLMKLSTYFKDCGDEVVFYKGDLKRFAANMLCEEFLREVNEKRLLIKHYRDNIFDFIRIGQNQYCSELKDVLEDEYLALLKEYRIRFKAENFGIFDIVCVTTLFTFHWKKTIETINYSKKFLTKKGRILVGGIAASIKPDLLKKEINSDPRLEVMVGLLNAKGMIDEDNQVIIDHLPLDYSILDEIEYDYPASDAYFGYMTRGCPNKCKFCAVPILETEYCNYISIREQIEIVDRKYGAKRDLLLMDNNVFASDDFNQIVDEIRECGFGRGATYKVPNEYDIVFESIRVAKRESAVRGQIFKIIKFYDTIEAKIEDEDERGRFHLERSNRGLLCYNTLIKLRDIRDFDEIARPYQLQQFKPSVRVRDIDFNQGIDARRVDDEKMSKLAEINIRPLRIAFDFLQMRDDYESAVRTAARHGIRDLSNYLLYNFNDEPEELYERMRINVELCEELGVTIYSFPMKYHPISDPEWFYNRNYIGKHWNRKFIRAIQAVLNATKGKIGRGKSFFEEAFGSDVEEFRKILWMPEAFIIYRRKYDAKLRKHLSGRYDINIPGANDMTNEWWSKFCALDEKKRSAVKKIVSNNRFEDNDIQTADPEIKEVLEYYQIKRPQT